MGYGCEMVYDDYLGIPIKLQVRFGQGWFLLPKREGLNILGQFPILKKLIWYF